MNIEAEMTISDTGLKRLRSKDQVIKHYLAWEIAKELEKHIDFILEPDRVDEHGRAQSWKARTEINVQSIFTRKELEALYAVDVEGK